MDSFVDVSYWWIGFRLVIVRFYDFYGCLGLGEMLIFSYKKLIIIVLVIVGCNLLLWGLCLGYFWVGFLGGNVVFGVLILDG